MGFFPVFIFPFLPSSAVTSPQDVPLSTDMLSAFPEQWDYILKIQIKKPILPIWCCLLKGLWSRNS